MVPPELGLVFDMERCLQTALDGEGINPKASCTLQGAGGSSLTCALPWDFGGTLQGGSLVALALLGIYWQRVGLVQALLAEIL